MSGDKKMRNLFEWLDDICEVVGMYEYGRDHIRHLIGFAYELEAYLKRLGLLNDFWFSLGEDGRWVYDCVRTTGMY